MKNWSSIEKEKKSQISFVPCNKVSVFNNLQTEKYCEDYGQF